MESLDLELFIKVYITQHQTKTNDDKKSQSRREAKYCFKWIDRYLPKFKFNR